MRTIKKYPNRRLYDTERSCYITLNDLKQLIFDDEEFEVRDANSGDDLTRSILLQIISDQESGGQPLFTTEVLTQLIRFYGGDCQDVFSGYMADSLDFFVSQQNLYQSKFKEVVSNSPMAAFSEMAHKNLEVWQELQAEFLRSTGLALSDASRSDEKPDK